MREDGTHPFDDTNDISEDNQEIADILDAASNLERIEGTDHEVAMDKLYDETLQHAKDLMDMGFNVDLPRARGIFEVATLMYGKALEAKNSKRDAQLKLMKLMLDKRKLDMDERKLLNALGVKTIEGDGVKETEGVVVEDRNSLIEMIRQKMKDNKDK